MVLCFVCNNSFEDVDKLVIHLKIFHNLTSSSTFYCLHCCHYYQCLRTFKSHFKKANSCISNLSPTVQRLTESENINFPLQLNQQQCNEERHEIFEFPRAEFENLALLFLSKLHSQSNFARSDAERLIDDITNDLLLPIADFLENNIFEFAEQKKVQLRNFVSFLRDPFSKCKTFYKFLKELKKRNSFEDPQEFDIDNRIAPVVHHHEILLTDKHSKGVLMPLRFQIKHFFELPNVLKDTLENTQTFLANDNEIKNIVNGKLWKSKMSLFSDKTAIPYIIYFDDFEINNPLGSHRGTQSIAAFYYSFPTLPQHYQSRLENIFPALFFRSKYKQFGNDASLKLLVEQIKNLEEEGIDISFDNTTIKIYFVLALIVGDNLGLNSILGYTKSFSSNYFCRYCLCNKEETSYTVEEIESRLRNELNYAENLATEDIPEKRIKLTGVSENSIFNDINSFHVVNNFTGDIMHDIFEGVCRYDVSKILLNFIETEKFFTIEILNDRKNQFQYGEIELSNRSSEIKISHLKCQKLNMSAREMWTFCHFLPIIIGDLIPLRNKYWKLLCTLIEIIDEILKTEFDEESLNKLKLKIKNHHTIYVQLFGPTLKPKFHFLLHYATIIRNVGPLKHVWCFRFESKHREIKTYTNCITSRRNAPLSVAIKCMLKFSNRLLLNKGLDGNCIFEKQSKEKFKNKFYSNKVNKGSFGCEILMSESYNFITHVEIKGTTYKLGYFLMSKSLKLFEIKDIIILENNKVIFVCVEHIIALFSEHFQSFPVIKSTDKFYLLDLSELYYSPLNTTLSPNGITYIRPKFF